jgi:hypothetical protein
VAWSAINAALVSILEGVSGIGRVHNRVRYTTALETFRTLYSVSGFINAWSVSREATTEERKNTRHSDPISVVRVHRFRLRGFYSLSDTDGTELTFQALVDDVVEAIRANVTLNGTAVWNDGLQVESIGYVMLFEALLVHAAECVVLVHENLDP